MNNYSHMELPIFFEGLNFLQNSGQKVKQHFDVVSPLHHNLEMNLK